MAVMQRQPETTAKKDKTKTTAIARISILTPFVKERKNVCFCVRISLLYHIYKSMSIVKLSTPYGVDLVPCGEDNNIIP